MCRAGRLGCPTDQWAWMGWMGDRTCGVVRAETRCRGRLLRRTRRGWAPRSHEGRMGDSSGSSPLDDVMERLESVGGATPWALVMPPAH